jgi:DNA-binding NarL/FixJ family response regulator
VTIRVVLADDHTLMREGLKALLERDGEIEVVGEAGTGRAAVTMAGELNPDVVIMDIGMPDLNGIDAARQIIKASVGAKILAVSMHTSQRMVSEMLRAGASGYVSKLTAFDQVVAAVKAVHSGARYLGPEVSIGTAESLVDRVDGRQVTAFSVLTLREREVLQLIAEGRTTKAIGNVLGTSPRTVEVHRKRLMDKLGIHSVAELARYAVKEGLVE